MSKIINILNQDGQLVVTSRQVAEDFEKRHDQVLRDIEVYKSRLSKPQFCGLFIESEYKAVNGKTNKEYLITRDGFSFLVMGFTGAKADIWKLKYIEAFNKMEQAIKQQTNQVKRLSTEEILELQYKYTKEVKEEVEELKEDFHSFKDNAPLFNVECKELQAVVRKKGIETLGGKGSQAYKDNSIRGKVYADIQHQLKREFGVTRYEAIKRSQLELAKEIVRNYKAPIVLADAITVVNNQVNFEEGI